MIHMATEASACVEIVDDLTRLTRSGFAFMSPNIRIDATMLNNDFLMAKVYHMICTPARCKSLCTQILNAREGFESSCDQKPFFVWEPMEDTCLPTELAAFSEALEFVDAFSPNAKELLSLCDLNITHEDDASSSQIQQGCNILLAATNGTYLKTVIARCGPSGCLVAERESSRVLPAFHGAQKGNETASKYSPSASVIDVTGGGNAFLGGFAAAIALGALAEGFSKFETAALYGNIAASFAIEQVGPPSMQLSRAEDEYELWNGVRPQDRVQQLMERSTPYPRQVQGRHLAMFTA